MPQLTKAERETRASLPKASKYRYLSSDDLRRKRTLYLNAARELSFEYHDLLARGADTVTLEDVRYRIRKILGGVGRCTCILRDRWDE